MARSQSRRQRQRLRQLETALAQAQAPARLPALPLGKSASTMARLPVPRTSAALVEPAYPSQVPALEPWRTPELFGGFQRGRLFGGYGSGISFELLRLAVKRCALVQAIHAVCTHDILQLSKFVATPELLGCRVQHQATQDEGLATDSPALTARCARVTRFLQTPHPVLEPSFRGALAKVMDDYLTCNRVAIELIRNRRGELVQWRVIDGTTILPTYRVLQRFIGLQEPGGQTPMAWEVAARLLEHETGLPLLDTEYVCVMRGQVVGTFAPGELLVWEDLPTSDVRVIFPPSYVEKAMECIISWLYAFYYNQAYWTNGNMAEVMIALTGDIQDDSYVTFVEQLRENASGIKGAWHVPVVQLPMDGTLQVIRVKENHRDMQFTESLATVEELACGIYRVNRHRVNRDLRGQSGAMVGGSRGHEEELEQSKDESFLIHSAFLAEQLTRFVRLLDPDLEFVWSGLDIEDRQEQIKVETQEVTTYKTPNELRLRHGDAPFPPEKKWADLPLNPLIFQAEGLVGSAALGGAAGGADRSAPSPSDDETRDGEAAEA